MEAISAARQALMEAPEVCVHRHDDICLHRYPAPPAGSIIVWHGGGTAVLREVPVRMCADGRYFVVTDRGTWPMYADQIIVAGEPSTNEDSPGTMSA